MDFYRDWQKHRAFEKVCIAQKPGVDVDKRNNTLRKPLFDEFNVYEAALKKQKLEQRKSFEVNSEEAAKELFFLCQPYHTMKENYTEETIKAFEQYATGKKKKEWVIEDKRVNGNPLAKTLLKLVDLCEEKGPVYGYNSIVIGKPAASEEITAWEQENSISLSNSYKQFLTFANGICLFGNSERIFGLHGINISDEYLEPDYINIGEMIGDGTMICMSKTNGNVYIADHGKYDDRGDFAEFLEYYLEFLEGM